MTESQAMTPTCEVCGEPVTPIEDNCGHVEAALPRILDGGQRDLLRRVYYLERVVEMLVEKATQTPPKRRGRPPKSAGGAATPMDVL